MLKDLLPKAYVQHLSLPLLGRILNGFDLWLEENGYARPSRRQKISDAVCIDQYLRRRGAKHLEEITREQLHDCWQQHRQSAPFVAATARVLLRFLEERHFLPPPAPVRLTPSGVQIAAYASYLKDVRGMVPLSILLHTGTISRFLKHIQYDIHPGRLGGLRTATVEDFIKVRAECLGRGTLQHTVAHVRGFLRFLVTTGAFPADHHIQIDTPRLYRLEQLPRALPWKTVRALLRSIDRTTHAGLRDYAMFILIATYGLRASEIVSLTLDDIFWRDRWLVVRRRKNGVPLRLPLTDSAGTALLEYLRRERPALPHREVFLRARAPSGVLKPTAVTEAFQAWARRSGLGIPYHGPHCLRHSYAVYLLRKGTSLKMIGALLGHRTLESTCVYLRLDTQDLRSVALSAPRVHPAPHRKGGRS